MYMSIWWFGRVSQGGVELLLFPSKFVFGPLLQLSAPTWALSASTSYRDLSYLPNPWRTFEDIPSHPNRIARGEEFQRLHLPFRRLARDGILKALEAPIASG